MKKLLLFICLTSIGNFIQAQTTKDSTTSAKHKKVNLAKELNLNDTQKKSVAAIHKSNKAEVDSIKGNATLSEAQKKAELKKIKQGERKSVEKLLTTEQKAKLAELQPKKKGKKAATTN
jgi:hypothetical protein